MTQGSFSLSKPYFLSLQVLLPVTSPPFSISVCLDQGVVIFSISSFAPVKYGSYKFPGWAHAIGGVVGLSSISCIPLYMVYKFLATEGSYRHVSSCIWMSSSFCIPLYMVYKSLATEGSYRHVSSCIWMFSISYMLYMVYKFLATEGSYRHVSSRSWQSHLYVNDTGLCEEWISQDHQLSTAIRKAIKLHNYNSCSQLLWQ